MESVDYIQGIHACLQAIESNVPIKVINVGSYINKNKNSSISKIVVAAKNNKIPIKFVDKNFLDNNSARESHQGVLAQVEPYKYYSLKDIIQKNSENSKDLIVVLDHIQDAGNLGAIIRSADAFGASAIIIPNKRAAQVTASTYKTSAGAVCDVPVAQVSNITSVLEELKQNEYWVVAASEHSDQLIWDTNMKGKIALVMGSEHKGISELVLKNSDFVSKLPMQGNIESLNVAQAFCACAYEWVRQNAN